MALLVRNLPLSLDEPEDDLRLKAARRLRVNPDDIREYGIVRRALDARFKDRIVNVYNLELSLTGGVKEERRVLRRLNRSDVVEMPRRVESPLENGTESLPHRPVIVGFGPAGMFAALWMARHGLRPLVLERGQGVKVRHRDILQKFYRQHEFNAESNLLYGEGGAGAYSDGKLYTRVNDPRMRDILQVFVDHGGKPDILIDSRPHLGSDCIPTLCHRIRKTIESLGGEVRFGARLDHIGIDNGEVRTIRVGSEVLTPGPLLLGIGHSAHDTVRALIAAGVTVVAKPFQLGVRVEHPQTLVDRWQFGQACGHRRLPPAEYHVVAKGAAAELGDVYSFCMCPGGVILPSNESPGLIVTNGASGVSRSKPFANSGLVLNVPLEAIGNDPLVGLDFVNRWERAAFKLTGGTYEVPAQRALDFLADRRSDGRLETSYPLGGKWSSIAAILPPFATDAIKRALVDLDARMKGFAGEEALVTGPETRASAPIRILRDPATRQSVSTIGLYPVGEGAGYAGGIMSAAADGIATAEILIRRYAPMR
ncbi:MAG: hypothetical protein H6819_01130 [Phycisphaerales bacterium]|nr:hypothetical protein [Phycisphaerales bacterium]MCB9857189.1 hypothetical protein [Phycisphaerales bacterium]MCB9863098.1 hypothetical protein [Phycisphaerales bacterium]